jgi:hypothetical protein
VPDVVHVAHAPGVPGQRVGGVDVGLGDLAAFLGQAFGGQAARGDEVAIGGADRARAELRQPGRIRQPLGELVALVGDAAALGVLSSRR